MLLYPEITLSVNVMVTELCLWLQLCLLITLRIIVLEMYPCLSLYPMIALMVGVRDTDTYPGYDSIL